MKVRIFGRVDDREWVRDAGCADALRVAPLLPSPTLRAVARVMPGRDGKAGLLIELES